jgi:pilus assembly protein Flp/PilA
MNKFLATIKDFARDEEGAQIVEYALVIAVISVAVLVALKATTGSLFTGWTTRVTNCLTGAACT